MGNKIELLETLKNEIKSVKFFNEKKLDAVVRKSKMVARNLFGENSKYIDDINSVSFNPIFLSLESTLEDKRPAWDKGLEELENIVNTMIEEVSIFNTKLGESESLGNLQKDIIVDRSVFIVHGHDEKLKQSVSRTIEKLKLTPVILHEQPNKGRTIIEKFLDISDVASFAVVLLSPDDLCYENGDSTNTERYRARQNVILELGFFIGKLGRSHVVVIYGEIDRFELPSDISGVLYLPYDSDGRWRFDLVRELKAANYDVDANLLI